MLQIDDPHLAAMWDHITPGAKFSKEMNLSAYRKAAEGHVEIINHALRGLPEDRIRYHFCWAAWHGPHTHDIPLKNIVDIMLKVKAQAYVIEAANARHEHEWMMWNEVKLPEGKLLVPGVVSHATSVVEHPEARRVAHQEFRKRCRKGERDCQHRLWARLSRSSANRLGKIESFGLMARSLLRKNYGYPKRSREHR